MLVKSALAATMLMSRCAFFTKIAIFANWLMRHATKSCVATKEVGAMIVAKVVTTNIGVIATSKVVATIVFATTKEDGA